ncbi:HAD-IIB family hydrolase [Paenibacillus sp. DMB5]|uniref:HAD-IIB family hydrolase n=1 Tax=Paenibacillus sp. DMB5 TaxID=1780103 RepID=UPI000B086290
MKYKLIALDVDGTLLNDDHKLSDENKEAIAEVTRQGGQIVLCTGRSPQNSIPFMEELGLEGYVLGHNGGATVSVSDRKVLDQYGMDGRGSIRISNTAGSMTSILTSAQPSKCMWTTWRT